MDHHPKVVSSSPATRKAAQQRAHSKTLSRNLLRRCNPSAFAISGYQRKLRRTKIHHRLQGGRIRSVPRTTGFRILVLVLIVVFSGFVTTTKSRTKKTARRGIEEVCPHCKQVTKHGFRSAVGPAMFRRAPTHPPGAYLNGGIPNRLATVHSQACLQRKARFNQPPKGVPIRTIRRTIVNDAGRTSSCERSCFTADDACAKAAPKKRQRPCGSRRSKRSDPVVSLACRAPFAG